MSLLCKFIPAMFLLLKNYYLLYKISYWWNLKRGELSWGVLVICINFNHHISICLNLPQMSKFYVLLQSILKQHNLALGVLFPTTIILLSIFFEKLGIFLPGINSWLFYIFNHHTGTCLNLPKNGITYCLTPLNTNTNK